MILSWPMNITKGAEFSNILDPTSEMFICMCLPIYKVRVSAVSNENTELWMGAWRIYRQRNYNQVSNFIVPGNIICAEILNVIKMTLNC